MNWQAAGVNLSRMHMPRFVIGCFVAVLSTQPIFCVAEDSVQVLRNIAFGSCLHQDRPQPIWNAINDLHPDLFIFMGDNIYANTNDPAVLRREYEKLFSQTGFKSLRGDSRILAVWDDNDYGMKDGGADNPIKEQSKSVFMEFFKEGKTDQRLEHPGIYASYLFGPQGKRVQIILLDTRTFRSKLKQKEKYLALKEGPYLPNPDPAATILGDEQWSWLSAQLRKQAQVRLIVSSIQLITTNHDFEKWGNFPHEREKFFRLLRESQAKGVLILSGDRHFGSLVKYVQDMPYPLYEITSSSLNLARGYADGPNPYLVTTEVLEANFGLISIDWQKIGAELTLELISETAQSKLKYSSGLH